MKKKRINPILRFDEYIRNWQQLRDLLRGRGVWVEEDLKYFMEFKNFTDWSLVYDDGFYIYKPPIFMRKAMRSNLVQIQTMVTDLTDLEIRVSKHEYVNDLEVAHICDLKNILNYAIKQNFPELDIKTRKKTLAGDYRPKRNFTVDEWKRKAKN